VKVVITDAAVEDLRLIRDYIAVENPTRADSFVGELLGRCERLGGTPRAWPLVPRYEKHGVRRLVYGNYLIFYRIEADEIQVIHVLHGARDYGPLLFPEEP
jgi:plasmid stabilization system protein ParE